MRFGVFVSIAVFAALAAIPTTGAPKVKIEKVQFFNQPNCYQLSNGTVDVIVTTDIGPRVIGYRFAGGKNILAELTKNAVNKTEFGEWHPWGGHRLWHAPEVMPRTYEPDDEPIKYEIIGNDSIRLTPALGPAEVQREILVKLDADGTRVTLTQTLTNKGKWPIELSVWGLTIVAGGGTTIIPQEPFISHDDKLLPARPMALWHFTDMSDPRWYFGKKYITLSTDEKRGGIPQKIGVGNKQGWAAYQLGDMLFVKRFPYVEGAKYPDFGCNFETYTDGNFMEVEDLGPLTKLEPGESASNTENWYLFKDVKPSKDDASIDANVLPLVKKTK